LAELNILAPLTTPSDLGLYWTKPTPDTSPNKWQFTNGEAMLRGLIFTGPAEGASINLNVSTADSALSGQVTM